MKNVNFLRNLYIQKKYPVSLIIFLTNRCNARCPFCFIDFNDQAMQNKDNELSLADYITLSESLSGSLRHLDLTGGEPFLRKDIGAISKAFIDNGDLHSIKLNTNGSYPSAIKGYVDTVCRKNPDISFIFQFSIDSLPDSHDRIRGVPGLFDKAMQSYTIVKESYKNCFAAVNLTVSDNNCQDIPSLFARLTDKHGIDRINPIIVRNEGVYQVPQEKKATILETYRKLTKKITAGIASGKLKGLSDMSLAGAVIEAKNHIQYEMISEAYLKPTFFTPCTAGSLFGVIQSDGTVYPCEILDKPLGNLRDYDFDFLKLWFDRPAREITTWIRQTKCNCHWECHYTYNIISSFTYSVKLALKMLSLKLFR